MASMNCASISVGSGHAAAGGTCDGVAVAVGAGAVGVSAGDAVGWLVVMAVAVGVTAVEAGAAIAVADAVGGEETVSDGVTDGATDAEQAASTNRATTATSRSAIGSIVLLVHSGSASCHRSPLWTVNQMPCSAAVPA